MTNGSATLRLSYVPLIAPATSDARMRILCQLADSFIYVVSRQGVTGALGTMNANLPALLARVKKYSGDKPTAVGFGVSTREHFLSVAQIADGVVVGSQIVTTLQKAPAGPGKGAEAVRDFCSYICGRTSSAEEEATREVGIVEAVAGAREPNGEATVNGVVTDADVDEHEDAALVAQLAALHGKELPER